MRFLSVLVFVLFLSVTAAAGDYLIGDGDILHVSVWGVPELSGAVTVRPDGKITLPAAGDVQATGLAPSKLGEKLTDVLGDFVKKPIVTVTVNGITNNRVYVSGGGVPAGVHSLPGRTTLFKFLCSLGSLEDADLHHAYLLRDMKKLEVDFYTLFLEGDFAQDVELRSEDILFIPEDRFNNVYILGAVKEPKFLLFREGMRILDAILEAGGFTEYAKENAVTILRKDGSRVRVKVGDLMKGKDVAFNLHLKPGDYVTVEEGLF
ncbi:polysaccharide biosynthesis/export family protein [Desulfuromonas sp. TF]|uniref:polysaccharide biosynthesis/export family protein n=1 Tax=Desulfuromonas sp. TF TaxID=1232410 RepID=UPI0003FF4A49|nr:polysaccharide biosynthesis/export family protein [Desulfuromonas sp. TF]